MTVVVISVDNPLSTFKSHKELLLGLIDGLDTHQRLFQEQGILHRDINPNNMVFQSGDAPIRKLMLVDFDYAVRTNDTLSMAVRVAGCPRANRIWFPHTSLGFLPLRVLRQLADAEANADWQDLPVEVQYEITDDLESFFYVFAWICIFSTGPNGAVRSESEVDDLSSSILLTWGLGTSGRGLTLAGKLSAVRSAKGSFLQVNVYNNVIEEGFTPSFSNLKKLAVEWQRLVERDRYPVNVDGIPIPLTHRALIRLLQTHVDALEDIPPRMPKKRRSNSYGSIGAE